MKKIMACVLLVFLLCGMLSPLARTAEVDEKVKAFFIDDARRKLAGEPVDYVSGGYSELRNAGFSDTEIREFMRPLLEEVGFSEEQIRKYFLLYDPLYTGREIDRIKEQEQIVDSILN